MHNLQMKPHVRQIKSSRKHMSSVLSFTAIGQEEAGGEGAHDGSREAGLGEGA